MISPVLADGDAQTTIVTWANMGALDEGGPVRHAGAADRTVQMFGTFNGATVTMQGSLDGQHWSSLTDSQGKAIAMESDGIEAVVELVRYIRPVVSAGTGVDVTVMMLMRPTR